MARGSLTVAVGQAEFAVGDVEGNLATIGRLARQSAARSADLLVLPELAPTGYTADPIATGLAEPLDGPIVEALGRTAAESGLAVAVSLLERAGGLIHNSAVLIGPGGELVAVHRKTHLFGAERERFEPGAEPTTIGPVGDLRVALLVCYEAEFPEMVRRAALTGAELIAVPTATSTYGPGAAFARQVIGARATENNLFVAYANHCGEGPHGPYMGGSVIAGPATTILAEAGPGPELCVARIDRHAIDDATGATPYLQDRRPELY